jgi:hypothetical protein
MELLMILLSTLAVWGICAAAAAVARDGYSRVPNRTAGPWESAVRWHYR